MPALLARHFRDWLDRHYKPNAEGYLFTNSWTWRKRVGVESMTMPKIINLQEMLTSKNRDQEQQPRAFAP
jgi:hypothetical protein